jgi:hypothetical protein
MGSFDRLWCCHFTICARDHRCVMWNYPLLSLISLTNQHSWPSSVPRDVPSTHIICFFSLCNGFCPFLSKEKSLGSHDFYVRHVFCELEWMTYRRCMHKYLNMVAKELAAWSDWYWKIFLKKWIVKQIVMKRSNMFWP